MTALRAGSASDMAAILLMNVDVRHSIEEALTRAGVATLEALRSISGDASWSHTLDFRCDPAGRQVDGMQTAAVMDTHDGLSGTLLVGCRKDEAEKIAGLLTPSKSDHALNLEERTQEAVNIIGSAYLNGLCTALNGFEISPCSFLPSPPRFLLSSVETMLEIAIGGQAFGDRGWIAVHRMRSNSIQIVVVWVPTAEAVVTLGAADSRGGTR